MKLDNRAIGVFDSGVGGITVLKELKKNLPHENFVYIGDTASFPYGSKSKQTIIKLCKKRIEELLKFDVKLIVIACGTATSQALEKVKKEFNIPIIGIINPTVKYLDRIGIIATNGTIRSKGWENQIEKEIKNVKIYSKACPLLAPMAEEGWTDNEIARLTIHEYLKDLRDIEILILGCTHYPLFKTIINNEYNGEIEIINTGELVAKEVKEYIASNNIQNGSENNSNTQIYLTDIECNFINVAQKLMQTEKIKVKKI